MKKIIIAIVSLVIGIILGILLSENKLHAAYIWDRHSIAGGMNGSTGVPIKVDADGVLQVRS